MQLKYIALEAGIIGMIVLLVNGLNYKIRNLSSDHYFHMNLIRGIKMNRHRFLMKYPNFIGAKTLGSPQFFHWLFSFINLRNIPRVVFFYKCLIFFLDLLFFFFFFKAGFIAYSSTLSPFAFFFFAALLYIFTPFNFVKWNASNTGLSPRSMGVLLGRVFVYLFLLYTGSHSLLYYGVLIGVVFLIILTSQFAFQYVLFFCLIYSAFAWDIRIGLVPVAGFLLFYMVNPAGCLLYLRCQYQHKKIYATHFAKRFILQYRPSIWRDLVYDFWVRIRKEKWAALPYIQTNALVTFCWGFTIMPLVLITSAKTYWSGTLSLTAFIAGSPLLQVLLISFGIMLLTSFAFTRFLGEPERYLEFATPAIIFLFIKSVGSIVVYYAIFYYVLASVSLILVNKWYDKKNARASGNILLKLDEKDGSGNSLKGKLNELEQSKGGLRLFSNNEEITRRLLYMQDSNFLIPDIAAAKTGSFFYKDIFNERYPVINENLLVPMIKEFDINIFVIDTSVLSQPYDDLMNGLSFKPVFTFENFVLLVKE